MKHQKGGEVTGINCSPYPNSVHGSASICLLTVNQLVLWEDELLCYTEVKITRKKTLLKTNKSSNKTPAL